MGYQLRPDEGTITTSLTGGISIFGLGKRVALQVPVVGTMVGWMFGKGEAPAKSGSGGKILRGKDKTKMIAQWYKKMDDACTYDEWLEAAAMLDELEGMNEWKKNDDSPYYDSKLIRQRLAEMQRACAEQDMPAIMASLRSGLVRNLGGIGNPNLHDQTHVGTKHLIRQHQAVLTRLLVEVADAPEHILPLEERLEFFTESRHALGKTALLLSGGASLGMYHFGVIKALSTQQMLPRVISGSSAGAIVAVIVGVRTNEELHNLFAGGEEAYRSGIRLEFFGNPKGSLERKIRRILSTGHLMDVTKLQNVLIDNVGHVTFHEAYERTGRIINITVSPGNDYEKPRLLNYLTAPNVLMWSAASASCALPGLYAPVELVCKNSHGEHVPYHISNVTWTDGSLQSDLPTTRLQELFNINYFIVSQTNPHAIPFVQKAQRHLSKRTAHRSTPSITGRLFSAAGYLVKSELLHRIEQGVKLGVIPGFLGGLLNQKYVGDVTIVPPLSITGYARVISNPTPESLVDFVRVGEKRTWPSIALVRSQCELEIVLDQCVRKLASEAASRTANRGVMGGGLMGKNCQVTSPSMRRHTHLDLNNFFGTASVLHGGVHSEIVESLLAQDDKLEHELEHPPQLHKLSLASENPGSPHVRSQDSADESTVTHRWAPNGKRVPFWAEAETEDEGHWAFRAVTWSVQDEPVKIKGGLKSGESSCGRLGSNEHKIHTIAVPVPEQAISG